MNEKSFLNKFYAGDLWTVSDGDFVKIIRNFYLNERELINWFEKEVRVHEAQGQRMVGQEQRRDRQVDVSVERKFLAFRPWPKIANHVLGPQALVKVHKMRNKDHPLPELNLNPERDGLATGPQDNPITSALVFNLPVI